MTPFPLAPTPWASFWLQAYRCGRAVELAELVVRSRPVPERLYAALRLPPGALTDDEVRAARRL